MLSFLIRLVVFLIVISIVKSVLRAVQGFFVSSARTPATPSRPEPANRAGATVLRQDPVCGTYVAVDTSLKKVVAGKVVHFCSPECRDRWQG